ALVGTTGIDDELATDRSSTDNTSTNKTSTDRTTVDKSKAPRVRVVATFSAPFALDQLVPANGQAPSSCGGNKACRIFWTLPLIPGMLGCQPTQCPDTYAAASPVSQATKSKPVPMFIANSTQEIVPMNQLDRMEDALSKQNVNVQTKRVDGDRH